MSTEAAARPWMDTSLSPDERADLLIAAMTLEQKIAQLHGAMETINPYTITIEDGANLRVWRHVDGDESLGIPRFNVTNGPVGVGMGDGTPSPPATALPSTMGLAAGFDPDLAYEYGVICGRESRAIGQHLIEAPGVCMHRTPLCGRNFEYFSEDPYLTGVMGVQVTRGIQDQGILAEAKHYVVNDQELERFRYDVQIDDHVLREIYLLPFEMIVKDADVACIMGSYQRFRGTYACESHYLLTEILRDQWGFQGYVQSDFWACRSTAQSLNAGMDQEMPDANWFNEAMIKHGIDQCIIEIPTIDRALKRRFRYMFQLGQFDQDYSVTGIDIPAGQATARRVAENIATLLKNDGNLLPLSKDVATIALIGQAEFVDKACPCGGGSSQVIPIIEINPLPGLQDVLDDLGSAAQVTKVTVADDNSNLDEAKAAAESADVVIIMAGLITTEGRDQLDMKLPRDQNAMIAAVAPVNPKTVLVLKDGDPVEMPWLDLVPAVCEFYNVGEEDGHAVADVLFGVTTPSGKLPTSYPKVYEDCPVANDPSRYPGVDEGSGYPVIRYSEGLQIGYRWYQEQGIEPAFPFGFGLSYTTFAITDVAIDTGRIAAGDPVTLTATVTNTGNRKGAEVVQVYVGIPAANQPAKRLVGFKKVWLEPGASEQVSIVVDPAASNHPLSVWDRCVDEFVQPAGEYTFYVGNSSVDETATRTATLA